MKQQIFHIVASFDFISDADMLKAKLESEGIPAILKDSYVMQTNPFISSALGGVKVLVPVEFAEHAGEIYNEVRTYARDDAGNAIYCPNCKGNRMEHYLRRDSLVYKLFPFLAPKAYKCLQCGMITSRKR